MSTMASEITSLTIVYSTVYSGADQRKHQSSASLAFVRGIHRWPHIWPITQKMFPFDDVILCTVVPLPVKQPYRIWVKSTSIYNHSKTPQSTNNQYIDSLVQDCSISSALAMEILQFYNKSSTCRWIYFIIHLSLTNVLSDDKKWLDIRWQKLTLFTES